MTKTPLPMETKEYIPNSYKRHTLFSGTQVVQTRFYGHAHVLAVVIRTGQYLCSSAYNVYHSSRFSHLQGRYGSFHSFSQTFRQQVLLGFNQICACSISFRFVSLGNTTKH